MLLIQRRGRVVEKQELLEVIWRRTTVEENTLTRHISTLRKILDERPDHGLRLPVLTVPGHGYQFVAEVVTLDHQPSTCNTRSPVRRGREGRLGRRAAMQAYSRCGGDAAGGGAEPVPLVASRSPAATSSARRTRERPPGWRWNRDALPGGGHAGAGVRDAARQPPGGCIPSRGLRQVSASSAACRPVRPGPDGRRVAYACDQTGGNSDIYVQAIGGVRAPPVDLLRWRGLAARLVLSLTARRIAFRSETITAGVYIVPARGGTARRIAPFGFHPPGRRTGARS